MSKGKVERSEWADKLVTNGTRVRAERRYGGGRPSTAHSNNEQPSTIIEGVISRIKDGTGFDGYCIVRDNTPKYVNHWVAIKINTIVTLDGKRDPSTLKGIAIDKRENS